MTSDLELTIFYRVYEEPPSNQRVVLRIKICQGNTPLNITSSTTTNAPLYRHTLQNWKEYEEWPQALR
jgi:hypothetical protein